MMVRSWTGSSQEAATGGRAATFGGSMMARAWTGSSQESLQEAEGPQRPFGEMQLLKLDRPVTE
jgi:hypothetical protein